MNLIKIYLKKIKIEKNYHTKKNPRFDVNYKERDQFLIRLVELELSVRTLNSLTDQGVTTIGTLVFYEEKDLKTFPGMGATSLNEIKDMLNLRSLRLGMEIFEDKDDQPEEIGEVKYEEKEILDEINTETTLELIKEFDETTLSVRSKNVLRNLNCYNVGHIISLSKSLLLQNNNLGIKSVVEIEEYINNLGFNFGDIIKPWDKDVIKQLRDSLSGKITDEARQELIEKDKYLEVELQKILEECIKTSNKDQSIKDRIIDVLINRFGLDGSPAKTLEIIGQKYNVTRERIRQNQENGLRKLRILKPFTPILDKVFEELFKNLPISEIEFNKILKEKNLTQVEWDFKGLQDFYENFGNKLNLYLSVGCNPRIICSSLNNNFSNLVIQATNKKISSNGLFSISECMNLKEIYLNNIKKQTIKEIIQTKELFVWLDDDEDYFTYFSNRNRLSNLITKAVEGSKTVNIDNLFKSVKNHHRLSKESFCNKEVFINFCQNSFNCDVVEEDLIFVDSKSKMSIYNGFKGKIISPNEQKIIDIFKNYGPILDWADLKELCNAYNVKEHSLNMIMQFSVLFQRIDRATYVFNGLKLNDKGNMKHIKIDLMTVTYNKKDCPHIKNQNQHYVEIYKLKKYIKTLAYPQPLRKIDNKDVGILYENKVYPVFNSFE